MGCYGETHDCKALSNGSRKKRKTKKAKRGILAIFRLIKIGKASAKDARLNSQKA
jgi:hypothetical protein